MSVDGSSNEVAQIITAVFAGMSTLIGAGTGMLLVYTNYRLRTMSVKVEEIHTQTNGMSHRLEAVARAQGVEEGKAEAHKGDK